MMKQIALLLLLIVAVYFPSLKNDFVYFDDDKAILYNPVVNGTSNATLFHGQNLGMYAPATWLLYKATYAFSGKTAFGYHFVSLLLHLINTVLVFLIFLQLFKKNDEAPAYSWQSTTLPFFIALAFGLHPIQVEAVSWAAGQSTLLFSLFYLAAALFYIKSVQKEQKSQYYLSLAFFLLALLSKSAAVTLPLLLMAIDAYLAAPARSFQWKNKLPYLALSLIFGLYTFSTRAQEGHNIAQSSSTFSAVDRIFMVCQTILFYPFKLLVPFGFSIAYPFEKLNGQWPWHYFAAIPVLIGVIYLVSLAAKQLPKVQLAALWYILPLLPMLPFITVGSFELRSDRYVYIAGCGIFLGIGLLLEKIKNPMAKTGIYLAIAAGLGILTMKQATVWQNGVNLFKNCVEITPNAPLCQCNLGYSELISFNFDNSTKHYTNALNLDKNYVEAYNGRGQAYFQTKKFKEAYSDFDNAIRSGISSPKVFLNRGKCAVILGKGPDALPDLEKSLQLEPNNPEAWYFKGIIQGNTGNAPEALRSYTEAINLQPEYPEALANRGNIYSGQGDFAKALVDYDKALTVAPDNPLILMNRAVALLQMKQPEKALLDANRALEINPNYAKAKQTRAAIYQALGQPEKAAADLK